MSWREVLRRAQAEAPDASALADLVGATWPGATVTSTASMQGGLSSVLDLVELAGAPVDRVVLRRLLPEFGDGPDTVHREVAAHRVVGAAGVPAPTVHWSDPEGAVLGRPALLMDHVSGRPVLPDLATDAGRAAFATAAAALHAIDATDVRDLDHLDDVLGHADRFGPPAATGSVVDVDALQRAALALEDAFVERQQVVHCDLHGANVLWDGTSVTAILDWPGAATGVGLADEAYAVLDTTLALGPAAGEALSAAFDGARSGPAPTADERRLWWAVALRRAAPSPAPWAETYRAFGVDVSDDETERRWVALVDQFLEEA